MENFQEVVRQYDIWIFLCTVSILMGYLLYRLFVELFSSTPSSVIERVEEIANLSEDELGELRRKNDPQVVDRFMRDVNRALQEWELYEQGVLKDKKDIQQLQNSLAVILEMYEKLKEGGRFSEFDPNKRLRDV